jgi:hypothetical protein
MRWQLAIEVGYSYIIILALAVNMYEGKVGTLTQDGAGKSCVSCKAFKPVCSEASQHSLHSIRYFC